MARSLASVVIDDLNAIRSCRRPSEAESKLLIDADAVLPRPVTLQGFQPIPRRSAQVIKGLGGVQLIEFPLRDHPEVPWAAPSCLFRIEVIVDVLGASVSE
ncbi:MAG: hypothetical protein WBD40_05255 [Tepidisphaeraceae bacterium]